MDRCTEAQAQLSFFISSLLMSALIGYPIMAAAGTSLLLGIIGIVIISLMMTFIKDAIASENHDCQ